MNLNIRNYCNLNHYYRLHNKTLFILLIYNTFLKYILFRNDYRVCDYTLARRNIKPIHVNDNLLKEIYF